jgi:hypothetical protein
VFAGIGKVDFGRGGHGGHLTHAAKR